MGQKICPLSFFNFYINKEAAQAGGCHLCVEESCAWWDETYQQCSLKTGFESIGAIADSLSDNSNESTPAKVTSPISDVLAKLRRKKEAISENKIQEAAIIPPPPPPAAIPPVSLPTAPVASAPAVSAPISAPPTVESHNKPEIDIPRPNVPVSELPVVSINTSSKEDDLKL